VCDGSLQAKAAFPALAAVLGTMYGAGSATLFQLPELRGEWIRGADLGRGVAPHGVGGWEGSQLLQHSHTATATVTAATGVSQDIRTTEAPDHVHTAWTKPGGGFHDHNVWHDPSGVHGHGISDPGHTHNVNDPGHTHTITTHTIAATMGTDISLAENPPLTNRTIPNSRTGITIASGASNIGVLDAGTHHHPMHCDRGTDHGHEVDVHGSGKHTHLININPGNHSHTASVNIANTGGGELRVRSLHLLPIIKT
jgi:hypothetical protein